MDLQGDCCRQDKLNQLLIPERNYEALLITVDLLVIKLLY